MYVPTLVAIMDDKPETILWYRAVLDTRPLTYLTIAAERKGPIGALFNPNYPPQAIDINTGKPTGPHVVPAGPSYQERLARRRGDFQPNDKVELWVGFSEHKEQRSSIVLRIIIPTKAVPAGLDPHVVGTTIRNLRKLISDETDQPIMLLGNLPFIVTKTPRFEEAKHEMYKQRLNIDNSRDTITSENLFTSLDFGGHDATNRSLLILCAIFEQVTTSFDLYVQDKDKCSIVGAATRTFARMRGKIDNGNPFRHFYSQRLQRSNEPHQIDTVSSLKPKEQRPKMTTYPPIFFVDAFEMTTRLGVGTIEGLENAQSKVLQMNETPANIRILSALGAGDAMYFAFLSGITADVRLTPGDTLKINFRLTNNVSDEDWTFTVMQPFHWCLQDGVVGTLARPRQPVPDDAGLVQRKAFRPYQTTQLPVAECFAETMEDARNLLESVTLVKCLTTFSASDKAESRTVAAMNILCNGSRPIHQQDRTAGGPYEI
ncbi:hypothetical protein IFR05_006185 [Cadophora sp. M221]|nr:hypothetical protein IFR05_006185 [Cadophora sp. M221]